MNKPTVIALLVPSISSVQAFFLPLLEARQTDVRFHLITSSQPAFSGNGEVPDHVQIHELPEFRNPGPLGFIFLRKKLRLLLRDICPDITHAHFLVSALLLASIKVRGSRWATFHGLYHLAERNIKSGLIGVLERFAIRRMDRAEMLNQRDYDVFSYLSQVQRVPLPGVGIDRKRFDRKAYNDSKRRDKLKELGIEEGQLVLLFVGRYTSFKGYDTFLSSATKLRQNSDLVFLSCGAMDQVHKNPLLTSDSPSNLRDLGWRNNVEDYMSIADLLLFPSTREGMPVTLMEAISMGLPALAYKVRGVEELIENDISGFLVEQIGADHFMNRLIQLIENPGLIKDVRNTLEKVQTDYSSALYVKYQIDTYKAKS